MYLIEKTEGEKARQKASEKPPFGPGFENGVIEKVARLEIWGTNFNDPGPDYCLFKAFDGAGQQIGEIRLGGY